MKKGRSEEKGSERCQKGQKSSALGSVGLHLLSSSRVVVHTRGILGLTDGPGVTGAE